jgi:GntR family transcriptional regulator / MocR family aminotransferase
MGSSNPDDGVRQIGVSWPDQQSQEMQESIGQRFWRSIDWRRGAPVYRQLHARIRDAILSGALQPGARLPSARSLASQLATARGTIDAAYELLAGEDYVVTRGSGGTVVNPRLAGRLPRQRGHATGVSVGQPSVVRPVAVEPFRNGLPALDMFPRKLWSRLAARQARSASLAELLPADAAGSLALRRALVAYLGVARGIHCSVDNVLITAGFHGALGLIATAMRPGERVWMEEPGYFLARQALVAAGARPIPVPVDREGLVVEAGVRMARGARFALVTPSHQSPLGVTLSLTRRLALLAWADAADALILEDDYDGEFRYVGRPVPALKSLDRNGRVIYLGTFSKVLFPALRLGYMVVPDGAVARFRDMASALHPAPAPLTQAIVAEFLAEGHFARHIKRMRSLYAERRGAMVAAVAEVFGERLRVELQQGGMHILARPQSRASDVVLVRRAFEHGLAPAVLSPFHAERPKAAGLLLGFANTPAETARREVQRLWQALAEVKR